MSAHKISISLPQQQYDFLRSYQEKSHKNRSEVIKDALYLLQQVQLEKHYRNANDEILDEFEITNLDGLDTDETW